MNNWCIFFDPLDYPSQYVARRFLISAGDVAPTDEFKVADDYDTVKRWVMDSALQHGNAEPYRFPRDPSDHVSVVEVWI